VNSQRSPLKHIDLDYECNKTTIYYLLDVIRDGYYDIHYHDHGEYNYDEDDDDETDCYDLLMVNSL
jgi:hypothetical protein